MLKSLVAKIGQYSPLLSSIVATSNPIAGLILGGLSSLFGADPTDSKDLLSKISSDDAAAIKIKQYEIEMQKVLTQSFALEVQDKANARDREIQLKDNTNRNLAYLVTIGFFAALFLLFYPQVQINETEQNLLSALIGMLASKWQTIIDYLFGTSFKKEI